MPALSRTTAVAIPRQRKPKTGAKVPAVNKRKATENDASGDEGYEPSDRHPEVCYPIRTGHGAVCCTADYDQKSQIRVLLLLNTQFSPQFGFSIGVAEG